MEKLGDAKLSSEYLSRHKISAKTLNKLISYGLEEASNPGLTQDEMEAVALDVATRWDSVDGQLANISHFIKAIERRAIRSLSKRKTDRITLTPKTKESVRTQVSQIMTPEGPIGPDPKEIDEKYATDWRDR